MLDHRRNRQVLDRRGVGVQSLDLNLETRIRGSGVRGSRESRSEPSSPPSFAASPRIRGSKRSCRVWSRHCSCVFPFELARHETHTTTQCPPYDAMSRPRFGRRRRRCCCRHPSGLLRGSKRIERRWLDGRGICLAASTRLGGSVPCGRHSVESGGLTGPAIVDVAATDGAGRARGVFVAGGAARSATFDVLGMQPAGGLAVSGAPNVDTTRVICTSIGCSLPAHRVRIDQKGRTVRRVFIVLLFALLGLTGTTSGAVAAPTPFPPGGQVTTAGEWHCSCGAGRTNPQPDRDVLQQAATCSPSSSSRTSRRGEPVRRQVRGGGIRRAEEGRVRGSSLRLRPCNSRLTGRRISVAPFAELAHRYGDDLAVSRHDFDPLDVGTSWWNDRQTDVWTSRLVGRTIGNGYVITLSRVSVHLHLDNVFADESVQSGIARTRPVPIASEARRSSSLSTATVHPSGVPTAARLPARRLLAPPAAPERACLARATITGAPTIRSTSDSAAARSAASRRGLEPSTPTIRPAATA